VPVVRPDDMAPLAPRPDVVPALPGLDGAVVTKPTFDEALDHHLFHGWSSGGPDPDCRLCYPKANDDA
jgi:hypothetical protein